MKNKHISSLMIGFVLLPQLFFSSILFQILDRNLAESYSNELTLTNVQGSSLVAHTSPRPAYIIEKRVIITAYSSTPDQTDSTPFITANGTWVRDGIVACNFLAFGTRLRFPDVYGDKVFTVEDRMAPKNSHKIDIWMENREQAKRFGVRWLKVEIIM